MRKIISKSFYFEAAHRLDSTSDSTNRNIHGHSYFVEIFIIDHNDKIKEDGLLLDFSVFEKKLNAVKKELDHSFLNEISGLENPTLENIGIYIFNKLNKLNLFRVLVKRKSCGESFILEV